MVLLSIGLVALPLVAGFPGVAEMEQKMHEARMAEHWYKARNYKGMDDDKGDHYVDPGYRKPTHHINRPNTGFPTNIFDAKKQLIQVAHGKHKFIPPTKTDKRGQCAGLNAAANHGFIPRNGISHITDTIAGLTGAYAMGADVAAFLGTLSVGLFGDPINDAWSIGGPSPNGLGGEGEGLYGTHNKYENDGSIMMGDAYLNNGEVGIFQKHSYVHWMSIADKNGEFTFNQAAAQTDWVQRWSIMNNPYYFSGPFSGVVSPAAHNLVIELMSNHSAERPSGFLTKEVFNSFFAVTGSGDNLVYTPGHERIPDNWYRRPEITQNNLAEIGIDLVQNNAAFPGLLRFGGNTGKKNSFVGVPIGDFTGGKFTSVEDFAHGNQFACFVLQASLAGIPDVANPLLGKAGSLLGFVLEKFKPLGNKYKCGELSKFDNTFFNQFPGANYTPKGF